MKGLQHVCSATPRLRFTFIAAVAAFLSAQGAQPERPCKPVILRDSSVIHTVDSMRHKGFSEYRACVRGTPPKLIVFRNGTEIGRFDSAATAGFLKSNPGVLSASEDASRRETAGEQPREGGGIRGLWGPSSLPGIVFNPHTDGRRKLRAIYQAGRWRKGIAVNNEFALEGSRVLVPRNSLRIDGLLKVGPVYVGGGFQRTWFSGLFAKDVRTRDGSHFRNHALSWTLGLHFIRYEMQQAGWMLPRYFWLEEDVAGVMDDRVQGRTLRDAERRWPKSHRRNLSHALKLRFGHCYLDLLFDRDVYRHPIATVRLDSLPSVFGTWGASLTGAADVVIPGAWLSVPSVTPAVFTISRFQVPLTAEPLRIHFYYWNMQRYNLGATLRLHLGYRTTN